MFDVCDLFNVSLIIDVICESIIELLKLPTDQIV